MDFNLDLFHHFAHEDHQWNVAVSNQTGQSPCDDTYLWSNLKKLLTWQVKQRFADPRLTAQTELTKDYCFSAGEAAQPQVRQVCLTKSYCFVSSYSCSVLCVDFKQTKISLMLLLSGREQCCPKADRGSTLRLDDVGGVQSLSVWVCFPLEACHSPHVIDNTEKRGKTVHLGSIYLHYSAWGLWDLPPSRSYTRTYTHTYSGTHAHIQTHTAVMTACRWTTWAHGQKWGHTEIKHIKRIPVSAHTRKRTTHTNTAHTHIYRCMMNK